MNDDGCGIGVEYEGATTTRWRAQGEIGPAVYVGGDSAFLKDRVYCVNVSQRSESSNAMVLSRGTKRHLTRVPGVCVNVSWESES